MHYFFLLLIWTIEWKHQIGKIFYIHWAISEKRTKITIFKFSGAIFNPFRWFFEVDIGGTNIFSWSKYIRIHEKNPTKMHFTQNMVKKSQKTGFLKFWPPKIFGGGVNFISFCRASEALSNEKNRIWKYLMVFELLVKM